MAPLPGQTLTIRDPGLGLVGATANRFIYMGCSSKGTLNLVQPFSSPAAVVDALGEGPNVEAIAYALEQAGGPVYGCRIAGTVAGAAGAVTKTAVGTSTGTITVAGASYDRYEVIVEIMKSGTTGAGEFRYSLDDGRTYSEQMVIPSGATYAIPRTNLTITFVPGAGATFFEKGDLHEFDATAPHYSTTEVSAGFDAVNAYLSTAPEFDLDSVVLIGRNATGSAAATIFGAVSTKMAALAAMHRYAGAIMDAGSGDSRANVKTALSAVSDSRIMTVYGDVDLSSSKAFAGFGAPKRSAVVALAARALQVLPSTDLARFASGDEGGPLSGALEISHDEYLNEDLDAAKISTLRTWPGSPGFYITNGRLKSPTGSDFKYWQHRRLMDLACRTVIKAQQVFSSVSFQTNPDGTIEETNAKLVEEAVNDALRAVLMDPKNAEGRRGHISAFRYTVDRSNNLISTETLRSSVAIQPNGYAKFISTEIGFAVNVAA
jgi:hypothetical protein